MERDMAWALTEVEDDLRVHALEQQSRRKDEFLAMLGHELRNPLAPMLAAAQLLRMPGSKLDDSRRRNAVDIISRQVRHMSRLVEDLLDVARLNEGKLAIRTAPLALGDVIDSVLQPAIEAAQPAIEARGQTLHVDLPPRDEATIEVDAVRMRQVLSNLLDNAIKYSPPGKRIWVGASRDEMHVALSVRDEGVGVSDDKLDRIFGLFDQADRPHEACGGGLGVGLALARKLVELQGGTIHAFSDGPNRGSEFVVRLPLRASA